MERAASSRTNPTDRSKRQGLVELAEHCSLRSTNNAYAVFNTLTDIAARPPDNPTFHQDRHTIEKRAGRWLKELARHSQDVSFDLNRWIPAWGRDASVPSPK